MEISMTATSDWTDEPWLSVRVGARYERSTGSSCMCVCVCLCVWVFLHQARLH